jgi:Ser/Thr protein kinase RdoA (MazF antagonist)
VNWSASDLKKTEEVPAMTQGMTKQQEQLTKLVKERYDGHNAVLQPISPYMLEDRGIYRVDWDTGTSAVLRAFLTDVTIELTGQATVLDYLYQLGFPAPQVKRPRDGNLLASYAGWTTLLVSFLEGDVADFSPDNLELLGSLVGHLHLLSHHALADVEPTLPTRPTHLPDSPLRPTQPISQAIDNLLQALPHVPDELHQFCTDSIAALQQIQQAQQGGRLPEMLLHGDCWPGNAVRTHGGGMVLIDWDGAGIGPAILDVGYLLLTCW